MDVVAGVGDEVIVDVVVNVVVEAGKEAPVDRPRRTLASRVVVVGVVALNVDDAVAVGVVVLGVDVVVCVSDQVPARAGAGLMQTAGADVQICCRSGAGT